MEAVKSSAAGQVPRLANDFFCIVPPIDLGGMISNHLNPKLRQTDEIIPKIKRPIRTGESPC
jgi:hypothetical protein